MDVYICDGLGNFSGGENPAGDKAVSVPDTSLSIIDSQSTPSDIPPTSTLNSDESTRIRQSVLQKDQDDVIKDIVPVRDWPGEKLDTEKPTTTCMNIDYNNNKQLYYILQSAKQILSSEDKPIQHRPWTSRYRRPLSPVKLPHQPKFLCKANAIAVPTENMSVTKPESPLKSDGLPTRSQSLRQQKRQQRPKTVKEVKRGKTMTTCVSLPSRAKKNEDHFAAFHRRSELAIPYKLHKYKPPDANKVKREYWQPWNEKGKIKKKDYSYLEIHYDDYKPESDDIKLRPLRFTHNHRHGYHWEIRHEIEQEKAEPEVDREERIFENEFKIFQLNAMLDKKLNLKS